MTDYSELKRLAEACLGEWYSYGELRHEDRSGYINGLHHDDEYFIAAANPAVVLALIAEIDQAKADGSDAFGLAQARADQVDQLKAVNFDLRMGAEAAADEITRLKVEVEAQRKQAALSVLLPELDEALESLEMHGRHDDQGYRKLKDWYRKVALACSAVDSSKEAGQ